MLTEQQLLHWDTFGFVVLRQLFSPKEMNAIIEDADEVFDEHRGGQSFDGSKTEAVLWFMEQRQSLTSLAVDDRIYVPIGQLLGTDFIWAVSAGHLYVGDTEWHGDRENSNIPRHVKVVMYTQPLTKDSGCLRFIPGSHKPDYQKRLQPLLAKNGGVSEMPFGVSGPDVPAYSIETEPGDIVMFSEHVWHGAFGGQPGRLQIGWVYSVNPSTPEDVASLKKIHPDLIAMYHPHESFLNSNDPRIRNMTAPLVELGLA